MTAAKNVAVDERWKKMGYLNFLLNKKSWQKTISWRIFSTVYTILLLVLFGFKLEVATATGMALSLSKTLLFYLHERWWEAKRK